MSRNAISANLDDQTHSCQSETSYPMMPKLGDHILAKLINHGGGGVTAALFSSRCHKKLENEKIFLCLKISEIHMRA